jgi:hypothetical protein
MPLPIYGSPRKRSRTDPEGSETPPTAGYSSNPLDRLMGKLREARERSGGPGETDEAMDAALVFKGGKQVRPRSGRPAPDGGRGYAEGDEDSGTVSVGRRFGGRGGSDDPNQRRRPYRQWQDPENYSDRNQDGVGSLTVNGDQLSGSAGRDRLGGEKVRGASGSRATDKPRGGTGSDQLGGGTPAAKQRADEERPAERDSRSPLVAGYRRAMEKERADGQRGRPGATSPPVPAQRPKAAAAKPKAAAPRPAARPGTSSEPSLARRIFRQTHPNLDTAAADKLFDGARGIALAKLQADRGSSSSGSSSATMGRKPSYARTTLPRTWTNSGGGSDGDDTTTGSEGGDTVSQDRGNIFSRNAASRRERYPVERDATGRDVNFKARHGFR